MAMKNLTANLKKDPHSTMAKPEEVAAPAAIQTEEPEAKKTKAKEPKEKKPVGRPKVKEGEYKTINIAVPISMLEKMEVAKLKYHNNLTSYVNAVIQADLDANYEKYLEIQKILNS